MTKGLNKPKYLLLLRKSVPLFIFGSSELLSCFNGEILWRILTFVKTKANSASCMQGIVIGSKSLLTTHIDGRPPAFLGYRTYAEANLIGFKVNKRAGGYPILTANKAIVLLTEHA